MNNNHKYLYCIQYRTGDEQTHIVHTWFETHPDDGVVKGIIKKDLKPAKFINDFSYYMVYDKSQEVPFVDEVETFNNTFGKPNNYSWRINNCSRRVRSYSRSLGRSNSLLRRGRWLWSGTYSRLWFWCRYYSAIVTQRNIAKIVRDIKNVWVCISTFTIKSRDVSLIGKELLTIIPTNLE